MIQSPLDNGPEGRNSIKGAVPRSGYRMAPQRLLRNPNDGSSVMSYWQVVGKGNVCKWNHAALTSSLMSNKVIVDIAKQESAVAKKLLTYRRGGDAGGPREIHPVCNHDLNSRCFSKCTKTQRRLCHQGQSINPRCGYKGVATGKPVSFQPKHDIPGSQRTVSFLRKRLHEDEHHRAQTIAMQQSRFIFQLVAGQHRIDGDHGCPDSRDDNNKKGLWEHPNKAIEAFTPARQCKW